jgi:hypothetical protein
VPGSRASGFSHPWPKRIHLPAPEDDAAQDQVEPPRESARVTGFMVGNMHVSWSSMPGAVAPLSFDNLLGGRVPPTVESQVPSPKGNVGLSLQPLTSFVEPLFGHALGDGADLSAHSTNIDLMRFELASKPMVVRQRGTGVNAHGTRALRRSCLTLR